LNPVSGQNLYRTEGARKLGGFSSRYIPCEDRAFWLAVAWLGPVCIIPTVAMDYRVHAGQMKWADIEIKRGDVWNDFIATLPAREANEGRRIRRAVELIEAAERARQARQFGSALGRLFAACWISSYLMASTWTGRPIWWTIKKCLLRQGAP
jgi:hypothetical protein